MITLVTGGCGSGKSEYGESLILSFRRPVRYYIATMEIFDLEGAQKVNRHREQRRGKGFITLEWGRALGQLRLPDCESRDGGSAHDGEGAEARAGDGARDNIGEAVRPGRALLLECVSNLAANEMFHKNAADNGHRTWKDMEELASRLAQDITSLAAQAEDMVIITNEVGSDGISYDPETMDYIRLLGNLNRRLADMADQVVEVVYGIPVFWKDSGNDVIPS